jgi:hypothetical protein
MNLTLSPDDSTALIDRAEGYALNPRRNSSQHREMLWIAQELRNCGNVEIEKRARRVLQHNEFEAMLNILQGTASNEHLKAEEYRQLIPYAEKLLYCGFADIEQGARQVIQALIKRQAKKWWQVWK